MSCAEQVWMKLQTTFFSCVLLHRNAGTEQASIGTLDHLMLTGSNLLQTTRSFLSSWKLQCQLLGRSGRLVMTKSSTGEILVLMFGLIISNFNVIFRLLDSRQICDRPFVIGYMPSVNCTVRLCTLFLCVFFYKSFFSVGISPTVRFKKKQQACFVD